MGKVLHASKSGYFPFCSSNFELIEGFYISGTLYQIMAIYWRVKRWKYKISGSYIGSLSITGSGEFDQNITPSSEENLVCGGPTLFLGTVTLIGGDQPYSFQFSMNLVEGQFELIGNTCFTGFLLTATGSEGYGGLQSWDATPDEPFNVVVGNYCINVLGITIGSGSIWSAFPQAGDPGNCSLIIEPSEYWSYGGTYDTTTGLPL